MRKPVIFAYFAILMLSSDMVNCRVFCGHAFHRFSESKSDLKHRVVDLLQPAVASVNSAMDRVVLAMSNAVGSGVTGALNGLVFGLSETPETGVKLVYFPVATSTPEQVNSHILAPSTPTVLDLPLNSPRLYPNVLKTPAPLPSVLSPNLYPSLGRTYPLSPVTTNEIRPAQPSRIFRYLYPPTDRNTLSPNDITPGRSPAVNSYDIPWSRSPLPTAYRNDMSPGRSPAYDFPPSYRGSPFPTTSRNVMTPGRFPASNSYDYPWSRPRSPLSSAYRNVMTPGRSEMNPNGLPPFQPRATNGLGSFGMNPYGSPWLHQNSSFLPGFNNDFKFGRPGFQSNEMIAGRPGMNQFSFPWSIQNSSFPLTFTNETSRRSGTNSFVFPWTSQSSSSPPATSTEVTPV